MNSKAIKRQLLAAIAMVLVAALALGSSTYAWFAANNEVTATGMTVNVQGESGIVIKGASDSAFTTTGNSSSDVSSLKPTSTVDLAAWYHAVSSQYDDEESHQASGKYTPVTSTKSEYVAQHDFYIRSAAASVPVEEVKLAVQSVSVTPPERQQSVNLNKAIRVGVKINNDFYIYAPHPASSPDFTLVASYAEDAVLVEKNAADPATDLFTLADNTVPANDSQLVASVFVWFEGEDENCKSSNITASVDDLMVTVVFTTVPSSNVATVNLAGATISSTDRTAGGTTYHLISDKVLGNLPLYTTATGTLTEGSPIFTIKGDVATEVTSQCTFNQA